MNPAVAKCNASWWDMRVGRDMQRRRTPTSFDVVYLVNFDSRGPRPISRVLRGGSFKNADDAVAQGIRLLLTAEGAYEKVQLGIEQANSGDLVDHDTVFAKLRSMLPRK